MSGNKCTQGGTCAKGSSLLLTLTSFVYMFATSCIYGGLLGAPVALFIYFLMPGIFSSFAQTLFCSCASVAVLFFGLSFVGRLVQMMFEGRGCVRNTFFYESLEQ